MSFWRKVQQRAQSGDTLVEVMVAVAVLALVLAGAYQATTSGLRIGQNSIERTQASDTTSTQAEALRTLRDTQSTNATAKTAWQAITGKVTSTAPSATPCASNGGTPTSGSQPFWIDTSSNPISVSNNTKTIGYLKYWVEAYQPSGNSDYIDFYIRGCWQGLGADAGVQNTGIVLRLTTS